MKQRNWQKWREKTTCEIIIFECLSSSHSVMDRTTGKQDQLGKEDLNSTISHLNLIGIYGTLHSVKEDYRFYLSVCGVLSRIDKKLGQKRSLNKFKIIEIIQNISSDWNRIKLETNTWKKTGKFTNKWKLYITLFNNQWDE